MMTTRTLNVRRPTEPCTMPGDWEIRPLREGAMLISGTHVMARDCNMRGVGLPYLTGPADFPDGRIQQTKFTTRPVALCEPRDILITVKGSGSGTLVQADAQYCISRQLMAIRPQGWDPQFLLYSLLHNASRIKAASTGLIPGLSRSDILEQELPIPSSVVEQHAIASGLADVDGLIATLERLIAKKQAVKQGMMQQLLTGTVRLPGFTKEWSQATIGDLEKVGKLKLFRGKVISKRDIAANPGSYPIYSSSVHNHGLFGTYGQYMFDEELITWSVDGGGHFFYRPRHKFSVTNVCGYMRVTSKSIDARFLAYCLQALHSRLHFDYTLKAHPSVIRGAYRLTLPEHNEQRAIAFVLSDAESEIAALKLRLNKARDIKQGMIQELLTGRTRLPVKETAS